MGFPEFLVAETRAITPWLVAAFAVYILRSPLANALSRLRRVHRSEKEFTADFGHEIDQAREHALITGTNVEHVEITTEEADSLLGVFEALPELGISTYWSYVEKAMIGLASREPDLPNPALTVLDLARELRRRGKLDDAAWETYNKLRQLRNNVVHGHVAKPPSRGELLEYRNLAFGLIERLDKLGEAQ